MAETYKLEREDDRMKEIPINIENIKNLKIGDVCSYRRHGGDKRYCRVSRISHTDKGDIPRIWGIWTCQLSHIDIIPYDGEAYVSVDDKTIVKLCDTWKSRLE